MARKTTSTTNGRKTRRSILLPTVEQQPIPDPQRRGRKPKLHETLETTTSLADQFFPGGDEPEEVASAVPEVSPGKTRRGRKPKEQPAPMPAARDDDETSAVAETEHAEPTPEAEPPAKARRGRKPKPQKAPEMPAADDDHAAAIVAELEQAEPAITMDAEAPASVASAAHWDSATGSVTFDWTAIEQVAAQDGPNQAMAKLLLAARAEGANSRWPF